MTMAEDVVDGSCCALCCVFFVAAHGYPVVCKSCWDDLRPEHRVRYQMATEEEM